MPDALTSLPTDLRLVPIAELTPYAGNARTHSAKQIRQIAASIEEFGFVNPALVSDDGEIVAGHGRVMAAKRLGMTEVPVLRLSHLSAAQRRAYVLADNKLAENAGWDADLLAIELQGLLDMDFDVELTGFSLVEIDIVLEDSGSGSTGTAEVVPVPSTGPAKTRAGDLWQLGPHRLVCGDAQSPEDVARLMDGAQADLIFTDPPYNVPIDGNVVGLGAHKHREFAMASGEMSPDQFTSFLTSTLGLAASHAKDGAIAFVCMDWRHIEELMAAGRAVFTELKNLCVWNKSNAGMGTFYRSKHELVFVWKTGTAAHVNSFGLGDTGRYRTNVWDYAGATVVGAQRDADLAMHPTVKPVAMVQDALQDCSRRGEIVLDVFGGSGTTLIAAEKSGRKARILEVDPIYCDTIIRRWQAETGRAAVLAASEETFDAMRADRRIDEPV